MTSANNRVIETSTVADLADRIRTLHSPGTRVIVGITGAPGAGKSTLGSALEAEFEGEAVLVGMDGFHLAQSELDALGRKERKGAPDTFDAWGYVALLRRLRKRDEQVVYAPTFDRSLEESIGSAVPVHRRTEIILTEGNYLLLENGPWIHVKELLDEVWYLEPDEDVRMARLIARHIAFGRSPEEATERSIGTDEANALAIRAGRGRADLIIRAVSGPHRGLA